jgi:hypothetical protein
LRRIIRIGVSARHASSSVVASNPKFPVHTPINWRATEIVQREVDTPMNRFTHKGRLVLVVVVWWSWANLLTPAAAQGESAPTVSYHIDFGTDQDLIFTPDDPIAQHYAMWKTPLQLASLRSAPFIRITNDSTSAMQMQSVRIDFGDARFMFDSFAFFEQPDDGVATVASHTDLAFMGDMKPFLQIDFPTGLNPGDSFTFQVRIANTATSQLADYESSLWHKDFAMSPNRLDNALVSVVYQDIVAGALFTLPMIPVRLFEYPLGNAAFPVDADGASGISAVLPHMQKMNVVGVQTFSQTAMVPEPSSSALLVTSGVAVSVLVVRRRRSRIRSRHCCR